MRVYAAVYALSTGEILRTVQCDSAVLEYQAGEGEEVVVTEESTGDLTHYVKEGVVTKKEEIKYSLGVDNLTVSLLGVPSGMTFITNGHTIVTDGEELIIDYDLPGVYSISIGGDPAYLPTDLEVTLG